MLKFKEIYYKTIGKMKIMCYNINKKYIQYASTLIKRTDIFTVRGGIFMASVLVTGASGMIGMFLCSNLLHKNYTVYATDNKPNEFEGTNSNYIFTRCDISDKDAITGIITSHKIDAVVHLANSVDNDLDSFISDAELKKAKVTDKYIYAAANKAKINCFILLSSTTVYGIQGGREPIREENPTKGNTNYAHLKSTSEKFFLKEFNKKSETKGTIARVAPLYTAEFTQNLHDRVYNPEENAAYMFEDGNYGFSFCCVFNLIDFITGILAENGGRHTDIYNIADTKLITANQIIKYEMAHHTIEKVVKKDNNFTLGINKMKLKTDYRYFDPSYTFYNWYIDNTKARRYTQFKWNLSNTR